MIANGHSYRCKRRIVIAFDPDTFEQISKRAQHSKTSFAEEVRTLVEFGLESVNAEPWECA